MEDEGHRHKCSRCLRKFKCSSENPDCWTSKWSLCGVCFAKYAAEDRLEPIPKSQRNYEREIDKNRFGWRRV